ncbi:hypothetical protein AMK10_35060 [Streptomyces sp. CB02058]|nr:hypothetical protein AMK10_35060 [Streptomyces sp. CB02058]
MFFCLPRRVSGAVTRRGIFGAPENLFSILVRHAGPMTSKGWAVAAMAWGVMAVLFVGVTLWAGALGTVRLES